MKKALLFIPDISGFTAFVHNTEISHSQHIISELLELLIDANTLGLELVEIEGDALFYFKQGELPNAEVLMAQVKKMYIDFHHHLKLYENRRICQCGACTSAHQKLELKFVLHYGDIDFIQVKEKRKPIGSSVIAVHRLLKNSIPANEYVLVSDELSKTIADGTNSLSGVSGEETFSEIGSIPYQYRVISDWQKEVPKVPSLVVEDEKGIKPVEQVIHIKRNILDVYEILSGMKYRRKWNKGLDDLIYNEKELTKDGFEHTCVIDGSTIQFISKTEQSAKNEWIYIEQTGDVPFTKKVSNYFILSPIGDDTRIEAAVYMEPKNFLSFLVLPIIRNKITKSLKTVLGDLKKYAEEQVAIN